MTLGELLRALGAKSASEVTIETIPSAAGSDARAVDVAATKRAEAMARGDAVARRNGTTRGVSASEAAALIAAGAADAR